MEHVLTRLAMKCALLVAVFWSLTPVAASAQVAADPATVIARYSAALEAQDVQGALALFDQRYGSATDAQGHTFSGPDGLSTFLLGNGFGNADAQITTHRLTLVANRAIWTYSCSCARDDVTVHMVLTINGTISVFAMIPPAAQPLATRSTPEIVPWLIGISLPCLAALGWTLGARRGRADAPPLRPMQGQLILRLRRTRS